MKKMTVIKWIGALLVVLMTAGALSVSAKAAPVTMPDGTVFDAVYYAETYPDLMAAYGYDEAALWHHFVVFGRSEGRHPSAEWQAPVGGGNIEDVQQPGGPYHILVNRAANTVTVMAMGPDGTFSQPVTAFVCSTGGYGTPLGTYTTTAGRRWGLLYGNVWGQYSTRITGPILFHSVPYLQADCSTLEYWEYNKLGTSASLGCVRLTTADAKWIFDNCAPGTLVTIYDDEANPGPLGKPVAPQISPESPNRGWDPTDPDPANPWRK